MSSRRSRLRYVLYISMIFFCGFLLGSISRKKADLDALLRGQLPYFNSTVTQSQPLPPTFGPPRFQLDATDNFTISKHYNRHFVYIAIGKTGSLQTRRYLKAFCYIYNVSCLAVAQLCHSSPSIELCLGKVNRDIGYTEKVGTGDMTINRMMHGCCPPYANKYSKIGLDAVVDHFPLNVPENWEFVHHKMPSDSVSFVTIREPVSHFISYHHMLAGGGMLKVCIDVFYSHFTKSKTITTAELSWFMQITNYQSRFMGFDTSSNDNSTLFRALEELNSIDVVGLTAQLKESWRRFAIKMNWPMHFFTQERVKALKLRMGKSFAKTVGIMDKEVDAEIGGDARARDNGSNVGGRTKGKLSEEYLRKVREITWADQLLYERAEQVFEKQTALFPKL